MPCPGVIRARWTTIADGSVTQRWLCIPVESTYACKTRGEVALWVTRGHREGRTEKDVARGGEDGDG